MFQLTAQPPAPRHTHDSAIAALDAALALREAGHAQVRILDASTGKKYRVSEFTTNYWRAA